MPAKPGQTRTGQDWPPGLAKGSQAWSDQIRRGVDAYLHMKLDAPAEVSLFLFVSGLNLSGSLRLAGVLLSSCEITPVAIPVTVPWCCSLVLQPGAAAWCCSLVL